MLILLNMVVEISPNQKIFFPDHVAGIQSACPYQELIFKGGQDQGRDRNNQDQD